MAVSASVVRTRSLLPALEIEIVSFRFYRHSSSSEENESPIPYCLRYLWEEALVVVDRTLVAADDDLPSRRCTSPLLRRPEDRPLRRSCSLLSE